MRLAAVDDDDEASHPAPSESPAVHVKLLPDGPWHRIAIDQGRITSDLWSNDRSKASTACGRPVTLYYSLREESYAGRLCSDGCFTPHEFSLASSRPQSEIDAEYENEAAERARVRAETKAHDREQVELAREREIAAADADGDPDE